MRHSVLAATLLVLGAIGACASSEDDPPTPENPDDAGVGVVPDADGNGGADAAEDASDAGARLCSRDGWCPTPLPDSDLTFKDIWPLPGRAFAIASSPTLGARVLEWVDAAGQWTYIDDATQNEGGLGKYVGRIWAPSDNEVYYGVSPGVIYHGIRPVAPQTGWSWTRSRLDDHSIHPGAANAGFIRYQGGNLPAEDYALGVWGTGPDDVYAWYLNAIFHWKSDGGGPPSWGMEYAARDVPETDQSLYFLSAAGTSRDDVWFGGARPGSNSSCALVVHKAGGEYRRAVDAILTPGPNPWDYQQCAPLPDVHAIGGADGWVANIQSPAAGVAVLLNGARSVTRLTMGQDGYAIEESRIPDSFIAPSERGFSLWSASGNEQWISGKGIVLRAENAWAGGTYEISTLALRGAPIRADLLRIRGTSTTNLWVIGAGYALHKTSP